jgi:hypothetical protein
VVEIRTVCYIIKIGYNEIRKGKRLAEMREKEVPACIWKTETFLEKRDAYIMLHNNGRQRYSEVEAGNLKIESWKGIEIGRYLLCGEGRGITKLICCCYVKNKQT